MVAITETEVPKGHVGGPPLYGRLMKSISRGHTFGNRVRMLKLPLIFVEETLYAGAIGQFFLLSEALEAALERHEAHPMVVKIKELDLAVTPGYAADLEQIYGLGWRAIVDREKTGATDRYIKILEEAEPVRLCAAAFILYGALVVGGGKMTQAKVRRVIPTCDHKLFDVAEDMKAARQHFKNTFTAIGKEWPEHFETLEQAAAEFMQLNNTVRAGSRSPNLWHLLCLTAFLLPPALLLTEKSTDRHLYPQVVLSIRCWGMRATKVAAAVSVAIVATVAAARWVRS